MAILEEVPGVNVTVQVNGQDAVEYNDPHASEQESNTDSPTSCKYIESIDDAEFGVRIVVTDQYAWGYLNHALTVYLNADGQYITGRIITAEDAASSRCDVTLKNKSIYDDTKKAWYRQNCKFAAISTVDDSKKDRVQGDMKVAAQLGVIEVRLLRSLVGETHKARPHSSTATLGGTKYEISEKSLKGRAISHGAVFSHAKKRSTPVHTFTKPISGERRNFAVYRFYYRSRDALRQEMIIPRSPSPARWNISGLSRAEIERLARERLGQIRGDSKVKEERKSGIKRELILTQLEASHYRVP